MNLTNEVPLFDLDSEAGSLRVNASPPKRSPTLRPGSVPVQPDIELDAVLRRCGPIPAAAVFLGMALDGLPVLLNLRDPAPGPLLIVGDPGSGKRRLLQVVARSADLVHSGGEVRHAIMTDHLADWEAYGQAATCEGVLPFRHPLTASYLGALVHSARSDAPPPRFILLLVDGLEGLATDREAQGDMRWLLEHGPSNFIWPIVAVSTPQAPALSAWLKPFRTVLCGRISNGPAPLPTSKPPQAGWPGPEGVPQFAMLSGDDWLPFWVPQPL